MGVDFYGMAVDFLGELPATLYWLYDFMTLVLVIISIFIILAPFIIILKIIKGGR